ncbi:N-acetyltransferase family 8 member 3-like [Candoia aspera]|uniref:N-acetyltransferase family 8 member 3-like n=1 Tax=Candoia aspera TaxID=51853 RepID=UPI002FD82345
MAAGVEGAQKRPGPGHLAAGQQKCDLVAGKYRIRKYEDRDYDTARTLFAQGLEEHIPVAIWHLLRSPQSHLVLLTVFLGTYMSSASLTISLVAVAALLAVGVIYMKRLWEGYIQDALAADMRDIRGTYLEQKDCCFWVVEAGKEVVGIVAAIHPDHPSLRGSARELKRMSVKKEHRGQGLSKALTKTVIQFSQECGYKEVVLGTSMVQHVAQRTYESMGFQKVLEINPSFLAKLFRFYVYWYCYKIPGIL